MGASQEGHTATVQLLLEAGADKDATDEVRERKRKSRSHTHVIEKNVRGGTMWPLFTTLRLFYFV